MPNVVKSVIISDEAKSVLRKSKITADRVILPPERLPPALYREIAKAFEVMGGKWVRKEESHIFSKDPRADFKKLLNGSGIVDVKKTTQAYYTPPEIANEIAKRLKITEGSLVLEPDAGHGALADAAKSMGGNVICCEIDDNSAEILMNKHYDVWHGDFTKLHTQIEEANGKFDFIIMNPPFNNNQDIEHATIALGMLKSTGSMACIMTARFKTSNLKVAKRFRELLDNMLVHKYETFSLPVFEGSGSSVAPTCLLITPKKGKLDQKRIAKLLGADTSESFDVGHGALGAIKAGQQYIERIR